jgi:hypothetical protein
MHYGDGCFWGDAGHISPKKTVQHEISNNEDSLAAEIRQMAGHLFGGNQQDGGWNVKKEG